MLVQIGLLEVVTWEAMRSFLFVVGTVIIFRLGLANIQLIRVWWIHTVGRRKKPPPVKKWPIFKLLFHRYNIHS